MEERTARASPQAGTAPSPAKGESPPGSGQGRPFSPRSQGSLAQTASPQGEVDPPEFLLHDDGCSASLPSLATFLITPVILLDQHSSAPALLEFFLFVVTSEFTLD